MPLRRFIHASPLPVSAAAAFAWHARPGAFARLSPPWAPAELISETGAEKPGALEVGARKEIVMRTGPLRRHWIAEHTACQPPDYFVDRQTAGPFKSWEHTHAFIPDGDGCKLEDRVEYQLPWGVLGDSFGARYLGRELERVFNYRHAVTAGDLAAWKKYQESGTSPMKILISGASGLVGKELTALLTTQGHEVVALVRERGASGIYWNPEGEGKPGELDREALARAAPDAVVHLAGDNIAQGRWNDAKKARIMDSRVKGTALLAGALARMAKPPALFISASAVGWYGDRGDEQLREASAPGDDFLARVCKAWEAACEPACAKGIRTVNLRFGFILSPQGGGLAKLLLPFKLGGGGILGSGKQWMSWIALDDVAGAILHTLHTHALSGAVNTVAPHPVTNREFTKTLGKVLGRPTILPMPAFAAKLAFGEMAEALLLASQRVSSDTLVNSGYTFRHPDLEGALRFMLGK